MAGINIMAGGEAGQGIQSVGGILAKALARGGYDIFADQDYESRVRGGHNFFRIRVEEVKVGAIQPGLDILIALNRQTVDIHRGELQPGGLIMYDGEKIKLEDTAGCLSVPFTKLAFETTGNPIMENTAAAGAALGLINFDFSILTAALEEEFRGKSDKVIQDNIAAARAGYDYAKNNCRDCQLPRLAARDAGQRLLVNAHEALGLGALAAGCKFMAGYPMTPASNIMEFIADKGREYGAVTVHVEDEVAAINMAAGAGYAGVRAMTATSGGGFALMVEGLALTGMTETPVVVVIAQRPGPATGLPTRTEQGELFFALHAGHGEFARAVFAPSDATDAFYTTVKAFNIAEKYQTPVIILTDQHLSSSYTTIDRFDLSKIQIERGALLTDAEANQQIDYKRHRVTATGVSPRALPGQGKALVVTDSDAHDEAGHMIEDAATRNQQAEKRLRKLEGMRNEVTPPEFRPASGAKATLAGWGSTYGAIREAAERLEKDGLPVNTLHFSQLWPFPAEATKAALTTGAKNIVVESNATGQLAGLIRRETGIKADANILKYDGRPFTPPEIAERVRKEAGIW